MKKIPQRTCVGCNHVKLKKELIRIVKNKQGEISVDSTGRKEGRGAYLCNDINCLDKAIKTKRLERIFEIKIEEDIYQNLRGVMSDK